MSKPIFEIANAEVFRNQNQVFSNLNFVVEHGEHVAILGPNGSGKTTLLKLLTREIYPVVKEGSYIKLFSEEHVNIWPLREKIGIVSHEYQNHYQAIATGLDVVLSAFFGSVGIHQHHQVSEYQIALAEQTLKKYGIDDLRDKQYLQLSTGQQRRLLLARATIHDPEVIIFDEPTNSLDVSAAFQIIRDMRELAQRGKTLVLVTHHLQEIIPEIDRVATLRNGKIVSDGKKSNVLTSECLSDLFNTPIKISQQNQFYQWAPDV